MQTVQTCYLVVNQILHVLILQMIYVLSVYNKKEKYHRMTVCDVLNFEDIASIDEILV